MLTDKIRDWDLMAHDGYIESAISEIYDHTDAMMQRGEFAAIDEALACVEPDDLHREIAYSLLVALLPARTRLTSYEKFNQWAQDVESGR